MSTLLYYSVVTVLIPLQLAPTDGTHLYTVKQATNCDAHR